jgi:hypothetical protein
MTTDQHALSNGAANSSELDEAQVRHRGLLCIAVGTDPAGREHRIKVRQAGNSFILIDSRRLCRINAHWSCQLTEEDIIKEVWFVFRVKVKRLEYLGGADTDPNTAVRGRQLKGKYWKSWGRRAPLKPSRTAQSSSSEH